MSSSAERWKYLQYAPLTNVYVPSGRNRQINSVWSSTIARYRASLSWSAAPASLRSVMSVTVPTIRRLVPSRGFTSEPRARNQRTPPSLDNIRSSTSKPPGSAPNGRLGVGRHAFEIGRVHPPPPVGDLIGNLAFLKAQHGFEGGVHVEVAGAHIPVPKTDVPSRGCQLEASLTLAQRFVI